MKHTLPCRFILGMLTLVCILFSNRISAQEVDTIDVTNYDIHLDLKHQSPDHVIGHAYINFKLLVATNTIRFDLVADMNNMSVKLGNQETENFTYDGRNLQVNLGENHQAGDQLLLEVIYRVNGHVESAGFGGFHIDHSIIYNLGVAFTEDPPSVGRTWFPCHDNFHDKATYSLHYITPIGWTTTSSGTLVSRTFNEDGSETSEWVVPSPLPTYLIGMACTNLHRHERTIHSIYGDYPLIAAYCTEDTNHIVQAFTQLDSIVPLYERLFGPYRWQSIGYTGTPRGSMEHANNIALIDVAMGNVGLLEQSTMAHELAHSWFGNLITCASANDMWINEGGASFCEELAMEAAHGKQWGRDIYLANMRDALIGGDEGMAPLYGPEFEYIYGTNTYKRGAMVWRSLKSYMGDSLFYSSLRTLFERNSFSNLDSWQIRDSLSAISGMNLTDFFDFHIFTGGFLDYIIDEMSCESNGDNHTVSLRVRQRSNGEDRHPVVRSQRIPVTFFKGRDPISTQTITMDNSETTLLFQMEQQPDYAIIDYYNTFSDAVLEEQGILGRRGDVIDDPEYTRFKAFVNGDDNDTAFIHVDYHYCSPDGEWKDDEISNPGIKRLDNHYWVIKGDVPEKMVKRGYFYYNRGTRQSDFYTNSAQLDSMRLIYRENSSHPWQMLKATRTGNGSSGFFFLSKLMMGEYALAMIDENTLVISNIDDKHDGIIVYPNPSCGNITIGLACEEKEFTLSIFDINGHAVVNGRPIQNHQSIDTQLPSGSYTVRITNKEGKIIGTRTIIIQ